MSAQAKGEVDQLSKLTRDRSNLAFDSATVSHSEPVRSLQIVMVPRKCTALVVFPLTRTTACCLTG